MDPSLFTALCGLLIVVSLGIQHGLQVGTFPARAHFLEPYRSFLACLPGGATAGLMAASTGASWQQALAAGLSGCAGGLQGAFAAFWPKAKPSGGGDASSSGAPPPAPRLPSPKDPPAAANGAARLAFPLDIIWPHGPLFPDRFAELRRQLEADGGDLTIPGGAAGGKGNDGLQVLVAFKPRRTAYEFARDHLRALGLRLSVGSSEPL